MPWLHTDTLGDPAGSTYAKLFDIAGSYGRTLNTWTFEHLMAPDGFPLILTACTAETMHAIVSRMLREGTATRV